MDHQAFAQLLGNYGEFFGAIAVVVTLVFLASQVRQSTRWQQTQAFNATTGEARRWAGRIAENGALNDIFVKGCSDYASLTDQERSRFDRLIAEQFSLFTRSNELVEASCGQISFGKLMNASTSSSAVSMSSPSLGNRTRSLSAVSRH